MLADQLHRHSCRTIGAETNLLARDLLSPYPDQRATETTPRMAQAIHELLHPGLMMIIADASAPVSSRSSRSLVIATQHDPSGWQIDVNKLYPGHSDCGSTGQAAMLRCEKEHSLIWLTIISVQ
jgi:hypothetical protein